ncbi:MAG: hypothetical protein ABI583_09220 [Betaproteobacteria bacterium]
MDAFKEQHPTWTLLLHVRSSALKEYWEKATGETLPIVLMHNMLRDFEAMAELAASKEPCAIGHAIVIGNRTDEIEHWLNTTRTEISQEEMDMAVADLLHKGESDDSSDEWSECLAALRETPIKPFRKGENS